ncbi:MAG: DUF1566 domain-containing protein [Proteobacteria bacterium]|jgi:hypothetical protein|nr:DUF1566 domain-containing protein [Pseudomonadota bacterium]
MGRDALTLAAAAIVAGALSGCGRGGAAGPADGGACASWGAPGCAEGWYDCATGLCWQNPSTCHAEEDLSDARERCEGLDDGGETDWRLPSVDELRGLIRGCEATAPGGACGITEGSSTSELDGSCDGCGFRCGPGADGLYLDPALDDNDYYSRTYWTTSIDASWKIPVAWTVNFEYGRVSPAPVDDVWLKSVRCVRRAGEGSGPPPDLPAGECDSDCSYDEAEAAEAAIEDALAGADACFSGTVGAAPQGDPELSVYLEDCWWGGFMLCDGEPWWLADAAAAFESVSTECLVTYSGFHYWHMGQAHTDLEEIIALVVAAECGSWADEEFHIVFDSTGRAAIPAAPSVDPDDAACVAAALEEHEFPCLAGLTLCGCYGTWE